MVTKWIEYSAEPPTVSLADRNDFTRTGSYRPAADRIRIFRNQQHPHGTTAERRRTEVQVVGRLIRNPKLSTGHGQLRDDRPVVTIDSVKFNGTEGVLVEVNRARTIPH
jgi:hypothetical protein